MLIIDILLIIFMLVTAYMATRTPSLISAAFLMGAFSFFLAILWSDLAAPDVSFTEAVVGAGASTIFILLALLGSKNSIVEKRSSRFSVLAFVVTGLLGSVFLWASLDLPAFGDINAAAQQYLSPYYLENAYKLTKTPNVVTAVVVDYRSFDTLIEATVIFTAGVACLLIFRKEEPL